MRVLHVYRTYYPDPPGGLQEAIRQICLAVQPHGIDNTIFTLSPQCHPMTLIRPEAEVVRCRSWAAPASCDLGGLAAFKHFRRLAAQADLVHYFFPWPFADLLHQALPAHTPAVMTYVSDIVRQKTLSRIYAPLMQHTLKQMRGIAVSSPLYARTSPILAQPELCPKLHIIPLGSAAPVNPLTAPTILTRLGLAPEQPYALFLGVLRYYKGLHTLIQAAKEVDAPILIAGSGPEEHRLRALATAQNASNIIFVGHITEAEKNTLLANCCTLVLPSHLRSEAYGMVLVEASMYAKPLITCEIGTGTTFINQHNHTGLVVPPEDAPALASAISAILTDQNLALTLGTNAYQRYAENFSAVPLGRNYANFFRNAVQNR